MEGRIARRQEQDRVKRQKRQEENEFQRLHEQEKREKKYEQAVEYIKGDPDKNREKARKALSELLHVPDLLFYRTTLEKNMCTKDEIYMRARLDLAAILGLGEGAYTDAFNQLSALHDDILSDRVPEKGYVISSKWGSYGLKHVANELEMRMKMLQAQLYECQGNLRDSYRVYKEVLQSSPPLLLTVPTRDHVEGRMTSLCARMGHANKSLQYSMHFD
jgi:hypothetical protein